MGTRTAALVCAVLCAATTFAYAYNDGDHDQDDSARPQTNHAHSAAYVYISSIPKNSSVSEILAYEAGPDGRLHPVSGSPYPEAVNSMAANGKFLMAASQTAGDIIAFHIERDGSLSRWLTTDYAKYNNPGGPECGSAGHLYFEHTGSDLYVQEFNGSSACANTVVASFAANSGTSALKYLGTDVTGVFPGNRTAAYFVGNNQYAYSADNDSCMYYAIYGFKRGASGALNYMPFNYNLPAPPAAFRRYIPHLSAADPSNHLAFTMQPANPPGCFNAPLQLASYTVDAKGNLHTTNTAANMPKTLIKSPYDMKIAPGGKLLALAGQEGLQVFHFNGAAPLTHDTDLLTKDPINQMYWDNENHLYAISTATGRLHVFTITPTSTREAPGSPYTISQPRAITVQAWMPWME